jgi:hypothetical protein
MKVMDAFCSKATFRFKHLKISPCKKNEFRHWEYLKKVVLYQSIVKPTTT